MALEDAFKSLLRTAFYQQISLEKGTERMHFETSSAFETPDPCRF